MKKLTGFVALLIFFFSDAIAQVPSLVWSAPEVVYNNTIAGFTRPKIVLTAGNVPVITWSKPGTPNGGNIYSVRWNGTGFGAPIKLNPMNVSVASGMMAGLNMASRGDTVYVVFGTYPYNTGRVYIVRSFNGGVSFSDTIRVTWLPPISWLADVKVDDTGNPLVAFMKLNTDYTNARQYYAHSTDAGSTFTVGINASSVAPGEVCDCCSVGLTSKGSKRAVMFRNNNNNLRDIWAALSVDGGQTFPVVADIDQTNWMISGCPSSGPQGYFHGDSLYTVWMSEGTGKARIMLGSSSSTSLLTGFNTYLDDRTTGTYMQNQPQISGSGDTLAVVWNDTRTGNQDGYLAFTTKGPMGLLDTAWSITASPGEQFNFDVAYANGTIHITYSDEITQKVMYRRATISTMVGINVHELKGPKFVIAPNPSVGSLSLKISSDGIHSASLNNVTGKMVWTTRDLISGQHHFDLTGVAPGVYFMTLLNQDGAASRQKLLIN
jgi:hypothetical protein